MARDYKHRSGRKSRTSGPPPWLWATAGLSVGLFIAFLVYLQMRSQAIDSPPLAKEEPLPAPTRNTRSSAKQEIPPPPKPRFDFYNLLPEMEVIVPEQELKGAPLHEGVKQVEQPGTYLLQAGSFRNHEQADQLRARLALLGMETSIQSVTIDNRQTWHRVRVGPYRNLSELNEARAQLKRNGLDAILIRLKN